MQDILNHGSEARLNAPSTFGENWKWRMLKGETTKALSDKLARCNWMYERHKF
jgi:4-alpha-glucanotransferase